MTEKYLKINKLLGETPLQTIDRIRVERPDLADKKMTYAGRLDPMAEGELLVLIGEECLKKEEYLGKDKEYVFEMVLGFKTDTFDLLGLPESAESRIALATWEGFNKSDIEKVLPQFVGKRTQEYPPYSSKTLKDTRAGELGETPPSSGQVPEREVEIYSLDLITIDIISKDKFFEEIKRRIGLVDGDFRQDKILKAWNKLLKNLPEHKAMAGLPEREVGGFPMFKLRAKVSSGTYIRRLVEELGKTLGVPAVTFSINRTKIL